ncbi:hypothetical protein pipiens_006203 [Culex pipiens pipiens]|uniref:Uncharacterized protein n=1 Tax=Culex pipiens pipiens TaxID=38569 RepID=A0ABD1DTD8_CULPP
MKKSVEQDKPKAARNKNRRKYKRKKNAKQAKRAIEKGLQSGEECFVGQNRAASVPTNKPNFNHRTVPHHPRMKNAQNIWIKTYQNIIKWHSQHQMNYWKQHALKLRVENARLKRRLTVQDSEDEDEDRTLRNLQKKGTEVFLLKREKKCLGGRYMCAL